MIKDERFINLFRKILKDEDTTTSKGDDKDVKPEKKKEKKKSQPKIEEDIDIEAFFDTVNKKTKV